MADALSTDELTKLKYHLGYSSLVQAGVLAFGGVVPTQFLFLIDFNAANITAPALPKMRQLLCNLERIECLLMKAAEALIVEATGGGTKLRADAAKRLEVEYTRWALRAADMIAVPVNPLARRFVEGYGGINVPVS